MAAVSTKLTMARFLGLLLVSVVLWMEMSGNVFAVDSYLSRIISVKVLLNLFTLVKGLPREARTF